MLIYHIATEADWKQALTDGTYTTSTRGRTLAQEGFIHACRQDQITAVHENFYAGSDDPLVLLVIDTRRLRAAEVRHEEVGGDVFPHIYGELPVRAVVDVRPLGKRGQPKSFLGLFMSEMGARMAIVTVGMVAALATVTFLPVDSDLEFLAAVAAFLSGAILTWLVLRLLRR